MTREEAVWYLQLTGHIDYSSISERCKEALGVAIAALREQPRWISVEERLPERGEFVLLSYAKNCKNPTQFAKNTMAVGKYEFGMFLVEGCLVSVTHWMPLPSAPKEEV